MTLTDSAAAPARRWYNVAQAAQYTGFSGHYIRDAANSGRLKGYRSIPGSRAGRWRFLAEDLDSFVMSAALGPRSGRTKRGA